MNTRDKVLAIRQRDPQAPIATILEEIGHIVSRERVRQILVQAGLPAATHFQRHRFCTNCGKRLHAWNLEYGIGICKKCRDAATHILCACEVCGKEKLAKKSQRARYVHFFCSNKCKGHYMGTHYGLGAREQSPSAVSDRPVLVRVAQVEIARKEEAGFVDPPRTGKMAEG